ncbi:MAG: BatA domain-containing protein [Rhodopirellula sp.]|nr:BatA domain-containing protein [Rhodopirellula sp.]
MASIVPVILAFGFASPLLLGGLVLAGIPILIHLLHKRRYVQVDFAAMRFLIEATRKRARRTRIEQLILLVLRTLVLALLVLALARPHFETGGGLLTGDQPVHRIVVVDTSFSMQLAEEAMELQPGQNSESDSGTGIEKAREAVRRLVENGRRGDAWNLVRIAGREPFGIINQVAFNAEAVLEEVAALTATDSTGDLAGTFETVLTMLKQAPEIPRKEVVFVTDFQASMWAPESSTQKSRLRELARKTGAMARVSFVNAASIGVRNLAVTGLEMETGAAASDQVTSFRSTVRNFGESILRGQVVELLVDGRLVDTRRVDLPPGIDVPTSWSHTFREAGEFRVEVHLQDDALPVDNRRWLAVPVREELTVLLVDGTPSGRDRESATFYVSRALDPSTLEDASGAFVRPTTIAEGELPSVSLAQYDVVVLCNVGLLTEPEATVLESFVRSGGGLVILPGDRVNADSYNQRLFRDGQGILPARLGEVKVVENREDVLTFDARGFEHPLVRVFRGNPGAGLESTMTQKYVALTPTESATVGLWFSDGAPALVESSVGTGRVILAATSADDRWGTWAIWAPSFVPIMNEMVLHSVSGRWKNRQLSVGDPILTTWPARVFDMPVTVRSPVGPEVALTLQDSGNVVAVAFDQTDKAGVYELNLGSPLNRKELYAVNVDVAESDLVPADWQTLQSELFSEVDVQIWNAQSPGFQSVRPELKSGLSLLTRSLAWTVFVLLMIEPLLAWRFVPGVIALSSAALLALSIPLLGLPLVAILAVAAIVLLILWRSKSFRS